MSKTVKTGKQRRTVGSSLEGWADVIEESSNSWRKRREKQIRSLTEKDLKILLVERLKFIIREFQFPRRLKKDAKMTVHFSKEQVIASLTEALNTVKVRRLKKQFKTAGKRDALRPGFCDACGKSMKHHKICDPG